MHATQQVHECHVVSRGVRARPLVQEQANVPLVLQVLVRVRLGGVDDCGGDAVQHSALRGGRDYDVHGQCVRVRVYGYVYVHDFPGRGKNGVQIADDVHALVPSPQSRGFLLCY